MSIHSAREHRARLDTSTGYCFPMSLDAIMHSADLPDEYYGLFYDAHKTQSAAAFRAVTRKLLEEFFGVDAEQTSQSSHVAMYSAYDADVQSYCPDVPYEYDLSNYADTEITSKHLRLDNLLRRASANRCNVLFSAPSKTGAHVAGLELIDPRPLSYIVRDVANGLAPSNSRIYVTSELSMGLSDGHKDELTPLPEFERPYYPEGAVSWELFILPPDPK